ncbi:MAG: type II toxin-antitoxin system HicA family toxin [Tannerella sp.]|nr:type II toxin-antitoxin system HicA family toxin [Tannerella sp.]
MERFKGQPAYFTFDELVMLLHALGFKLTNRGMTSGSRVSFKNEAASGITIIVHKPHTSGAALRESTMK